MMDIAEYPLSETTGRYKRLGFSVNKGNDSKRGLLDKGLIKQGRVSVPKGRVTLLKLTEKGRNLMESIGINTESLPKNASLQHEYYKGLMVRDYESKGYKVVKEYPPGRGKAIDLVCTRGNKRIAIEVETGKSNEEGNVRKCKDGGFSKVFVVQTRWDQKKVH